MIWSLSPFFGELDVLEVKLATLDPVVDRFVLAEARVTHRGDPKPLHFLDHADRFQAWLEKIVYVVVDDMPAGADHWAREKHQRDALGGGLDGLADDDLVLLSDLDEIPDPAWVARMRLQRPAEPVVSLLPMHLYYLNWRWPRPVANGQICRAISGRAMPRSVEAFRNLPARIDGDDGWLGGTGWHLAYMGGIDAIQRKLAGFAHDELDLPGFHDPDHLLRCLRTGSDLFRRGEHRCVWVGDELLPRYAVEQRARLSSLFFTGSSFLGAPAAQLWRDYEPWERLLQTHQELEAIVELGTGDGGFALFLHLQALARGLQFDTYDTVEPAWEPLAVELGLPARFHRQDVFDWQFADRLHDLPRPLVLFCDNGDKPREAATFAPILERGDILAVHDWQSEIGPDDIPAGLQPLHENWTRGGLTRFFQR